MMKVFQSSNGFTLMELMIAIVIFGLVVAGIMSSKISQQDQHITQLQATEMQQSIRTVMFLMKRELRMAGFNPFPQNYGAGMISAGATNISFSKVASNDGKDNDGDGQTDETGELETIAYALQDPDADGDSDITVNYNGAGANVIAENMPNLGFTYFDNTGTVTATLADIKSVQITMTSTTDIDELARATNNTTRTLTTVVYLRNMGL